jgi:hypothetical protein
VGASTLAEPTALNSAAAQPRWPGAVSRRAVTQSSTHSSGRHGTSGAALRFGWLNPLLVVHGAS